MVTLPLPLEKPLPSTCTLYHGDCLDVMPKLAPKSVQMCFADLPYSVTRNKWDVLIDPTKFWHAVNYITTGCTCLTATYCFGSLMMHANLKNFRYDLIWHKKNRFTGFLNAKRMPLRNHEHLLLFCNAKFTYNPIKTIGTPYSVSPPRPGNNGSNYGLHKKKHAVNKGERLPVSVLSISCDFKNRSHPTQKPVALLEWLITTYTNPGDTVLDPVMGSGTTAIACARLGRNFIGIEKDETYFDLASKRIAAERERLGL